ncbi:MAG TPA: radical SAM protein [Bacillota bacterium]|nr:radical SAM protein [Bacillota bacterium]HOP69755.1 radical SAM protein [Bacillota bacterium]HPT34680.1 radical SAM protein [Bacillota bacterium]HPZ64385.1 radical SAM protein [Bacillota bacterium]HQD06816.1 radical SAM protein [Bacillota bacterium]
MTDKTKALFEQGPIRPPSEATSLFIRLTRNCPWNRCLFCPVYKGERFSRREVAEIKADIDAMADIVDRVRAFSWRRGSGGQVTLEIASRLQREEPAWLPVVAWLYYGSGAVFLQDADSLAAPVDDLVEVLEYLRRRIPGIRRITTYARSRTLFRRSVAELRRLVEAGLNRVHVGLESGWDPLLEYMQKGVRSEQHVEAGLKAKEAGLELSEYVILGLGGRKMWREHALATARVLNRINPHFIRVRTLIIPPFSPLFEEVKRGSFVPLEEDRVLEEEKLLLTELKALDAVFCSDHHSNLLQELQGHLARDRERMIDLIDSYFNLPAEQKSLFRLGRRAGYFRSLDDLNNAALSVSVERLGRRLAEEGLSVDGYIQNLLPRYL